VRLGDERFLTTTIDLSSPNLPPVRLSVMKSFDRATGFLTSLNQLLVALGLTAVLAGSILVFLISRTFIRPLDNLVAGVRALEHGDYGYALEARGGDEVSEVTGAFDRMRQSLQKTQRELLEADRLRPLAAWRVRFLMICGIPWQRSWPMRNSCARRTSARDNARIFTLKSGLR